MKLTKSLIKRLIEKELKKTMLLEKACPPGQEAVPFSNPDTRTTELRCIPIPASAKKKAAKKAAPKKPTAAPYEPALPVRRPGRYAATVPPEEYEEYGYTDAPETSLPPQPEPPAAAPVAAPPTGETKSARRPAEEDPSKSAARPAVPQQPSLTRRQKKRARMRRAGVKALKAAGYDGRTAREIYGNFYAAIEYNSNEENNLEQILGKQDMLWGTNHAKALKALGPVADARDEKEWVESDEGKEAIGAEETKKAEAEELKSLRSEKTARISKENAEQLYDILEGWSTDEEGDAKKIRSILIKVYDQNNPKKWPNGDEVGAGNIEALSSMFDEVTKEREHRAMGDNLAQWLRDDGHDGIADAVDKLISKADEASKYVPPVEKEYDDQEDVGELEENLTYSSFPNQQKLHEGWNKYLKRNQII